MLNKNLPRYRAPFVLGDSVSVDISWLPLVGNGSPPTTCELGTISNQAYLEFSVILVSESQHAAPRKAGNFGSNTLTEPIPTTSLERGVRHVKSGALHSLLVGPQRHVSTVTAHSNLPALGSMHSSRTHCGTIGAGLVCDSQRETIQSQPSIWEPILYKERAWFRPNINFFPLIIKQFKHPRSLRFLFRELFPVVTPTVIRS